MQSGTSQVPRLSQLDTRQDSPMREDISRSNGSPANGAMQHGLPTPANEVPSSGFTAVNGDIPRSNPFRLGEAGRMPFQAPSSDSRKPGAYFENAGPPPRGQAEWRSEEHHGKAAEPSDGRPGSSSSNKRKRTGSNSTIPGDNNGAGNTHTPEHVHPKAYTTALSSGGRNPESRSRADSEDYDLEPATAENNVRAPSPIYRADRGSPPPPPPRESEDALAKSLQATLGPHNVTDGLSEPQQGTPEENDLDHERGQSRESDPALQGDGVESKKRKRNFSNRTKTGCHTCRNRKKKCDEGKPQCLNCERGGFSCGGYGPKPPGGSKAIGVRSVAPSPAKTHYEYGQRPRQFYEQPPQQLLPPPAHPIESSHQHMGPVWDAHRQEAYLNSQHRYGPHAPHPHAPPPAPMQMETRPPTGHEPWAHRPPWPATEPTMPYARERLPPVDFPGAPPPPHSYPHDRPPPIDSWRPSPGQTQYRPPPGPPTVISNHSSASGRSRHHLPIIPIPGPPSEREKMMTGQPYKHFLDDQLMHERASCKRAIEDYNKACEASSTLNGPEKERRFLKILDPAARDFSETMHKNWHGPVGECGVRTHVEAPFACEYGYNIKLGNDVLISANCLMEDACLVTIGNRSIVGKNVKFYCMTTSIDASLRNGSQGLFSAGAITVHDDCVIGANSIILPFRTIGKGAIVGAGSVVTRDVKPYTIVAGNPAKVVRKRNIEGDPNVDRHDDAIQEENERMLENMRKRPFTRERIL